MQRWNTLFSWHLQAALGTESAAKRTRLSSKGSPTKESALEAKRASQSEALDHDVRQVINYADEKVHHDSCMHSFIHSFIHSYDFKVLGPTVTIVTVV